MCFSLVLFFSAVCLIQLPDKFWLQPFSVIVFYLVFPKKIHLLLNIVVH